MAEFECPVVRIRAIEAIDGADKIELAVVGEYRSIVSKGTYKEGDLAVYLPEGAILPEWLITKLGLTGKLSGANKNRIKAVKLRGCLSQGILYPVSIMRPPVADFMADESEYYSTVSRFNSSIDPFAVDEQMTVNEGDDTSEFLGVKKWEPELDPQMARKLNGDCVYIPGKTVKYDLENWKKYPNVITDGEEVVITEKLHGTMCCFAIYPGLNHPALPDDVFVYSKGLGGRGQVFKWNEANAENLYIKAYRAQHRFEYNKETNGKYEIPLADVVKLAFQGQPVFIFGEVFGKGVQDLTYGQDTPTFRAFDIWIGDPQTGGFVDAEIKYDLFTALGLEHVPVLYMGPFSKEVLMEHTDGKTVFMGKNIREGVVVTPLNERIERRLGRVALKSVSEAYLLRKNGTEFN